jgi:hypothetical protein
VLAWADGSFALLTMDFSDPYIAQVLKSLEPDFSCVACIHAYHRTKIRFLETIQQQYDGNVYKSVQNQIFNWEVSRQRTMIKFFLDVGNHA